GHGRFAMRPTIIVEQPCIASIVQIMPCAQAVGAILAIAADGAVDDAWILLFELCIAQPEALHHTWTKAFKYHVGLVYHAQKDLSSCAGFEVQGHTALVAIGCQEVHAHSACAMRRHKASVVATARLFDFDNIS